MQGGGHRTGCLGTSGGHYVTMPLWSLAQQLSLGHGRHIGLDGEWGSVTGLGVSVSSVHMHVRACVHSCVPVCIRVCVCICTGVHKQRESFKVVEWAAPAGLWDFSLHAEAEHPGLS